MAVVYEVSQMMAELTEIIGRLNNANNLLRNAKQMQEALFARGELTANIKTEMEEALGEVQDVIDQAVSDIQDIDFATWPDEVRIGSPVNFNRVEIGIEAALDATRTSILMTGGDGITVDTHLFIVGDVVELVNPESSENAQTVIVDNAAGGAPANPLIGEFYTTVKIPGGVDAFTNTGTEDTRVKLILRDR